MSDTSMDGTEESITVEVEDYDDCRRVGRQTANELYLQLEESDSDTFELTVRSVQSDTERSEGSK